MGCNGICALINDGICMNLCVLSLDSSLYYTEIKEGFLYFIHPAIDKPLAIISISNDSLVNGINQFINQH